DTVPAVVAPFERGGVEDPRRPGQALGLPARAGVGPRSAVDLEHVILAREPPDPPLTVALELHVLVRADGHRSSARCPDAHLRRTGVYRHGSKPTHSAYSGTSQTAPSGGRVSVAEKGCSCQGTASASTPP